MQAEPCVEPPFVKGGGLSSLRGPLASKWQHLRDSTKLRRIAPVFNPAAKAAVAAAHKRAEQLLAEAQRSVLTPQAPEVATSTMPAPSREQYSRPQSAPAARAQQQPVARPSSASAAARSPQAAISASEASSVSKHVQFKFVNCVPPPVAADRDPFMSSALVMEERVKKNLASNLTRVVDLFKVMDVNDDGSVTRREFTRGLIALGVCTQSLYPAINAVFDSWDVDGSGQLDFKELDAKLRKAKPPPGPYDRNRNQLTLKIPAAWSERTSSTEQEQRQRQQQQQQRQQEQQQHQQQHQQQQQQLIGTCAPPAHRTAPTRQSALDRALQERLHRAPPTLQPGMSSAAAASTAAAGHPQAGRTVKAAPKGVKRVEKNQWRDLRWVPRDNPPGRQLWREEDALALGIGMPPPRGWQTEPKVNPNPDPNPNPNSNPNPNHPRARPTQPKAEATAAPAAASGRAPVHRKAPPAPPLLRCRCLPGNAAAGINLADQMRQIGVLEGCSVGPTTGHQQETHAVARRNTDADADSSTTTNTHQCNGNSHQLLWVARTSPR